MAMTICGLVRILVLLTGVSVAACQADDPCSSIVCKPGRLCLATSFSTGACICAPPEFCRRNRHPKPVCGSDGRRYASHCDLHRLACIQGRRLRPLAIDCSPHTRHDDSIKDNRLPPAHESSAIKNTPVAEIETVAVKIGCDIKETTAAVTALRSGLMTRVCRDAGLTDGCADYSANGKDAELIMDRIFAQLDSNSDRQVSKLELLQQLTKLDCTEEVASRLLGTSGDGVDRQQSAEALSLPKGTAAGTRRSKLVAAGIRAVRLTCQLGTLGPVETTLWKRRGVVGLTGDNSSVLTINNAAEFDSGVFQCCSSLWPALCASVALSVVASPYVQVQPAMLVRRLGESARLNCDVTGGGAGLQGGVSWLFNGAPVLEAASGGADIAVQKTDTGATLSIAKLERRHTGMFTCQARNVAGVAEFAATIYIRQPTETDYNSYPLSPPSVAIAAAFHAGGCATINPIECSVSSAASADFDDVTLCENLVSCAWGPVASAGRHILYAAQPSLGRLLAMQPHRWLAFEPVQLNCPPTLLAYRQQTDQLWVACDGDVGVFVVDSASLLTTKTGRRRLARRWTFKKDGDGGKKRLRRVLRLPDSRSALLVAVVDEAASAMESAQLLAAVAIDVGDGRGDSESIARVRLAAAAETTVDRADLLVQGGTVILHSSIVNASGSGQPEPAILALDLRTGTRVERHLFPRVLNGADESSEVAGTPTGRIFVSDDGRHILHLAGSNVYVYEVQSTGELSLLLHDVAGVGIRSARFQASPDGSLKILARTQRDGAVLVIDLKARVFQLVFDEKLDKKHSLSAPTFGDLALLHSRDAVVFFNTTSLSVTNCKESLFVDLQALHWLDN